MNPALSASGMNYFTIFIFKDRMNASNVNKYKTLSQVIYTE